MFPFKTSTMPLTKTKNKSKKSMASRTEPSESSFAPVASVAHRLPENPTAHGVDVKKPPIAKKGEHRICCCN
jgi:hypothetical protein